ncbi:hypothetical protein KR51_00012680 [Rubidibacter lacunae KORDI 51-2]|uniref:Uncharacterized protein n=1 Tax=Rubidibacter lacunae KORDI 51-2 TaxID=582515 RepID=U5DM27_9CHRO|nr:hypothetical protein [Rubidibacter lacunae]ERN41942.1 hypothetical protein KR51_00012680 [Rubidibacter lacunae KORDI 51-2]
MIRSQCTSPLSTTEIESAIAELEKSREKLVNDLFQMAQRVALSQRATMERIGRNPEIHRIDAEIEQLQAQQVALRKV